MSYFPVKNYTKPFWLSEEDFIGTYRSTENLPSDQDVLIVGSGYAGTSTAYYLLKENPDLKITMLEARNICSGATGRNGGHVKPFYHDQHDWVAKEYGLKEAAKNVEFEYRHLGVIKQLTELEKIDCDFTLTRSCDVFLDDEAFKEFESEMNNFKNNPYIDQAIKDAYQLITGENAKIVSGNAKTNYALTAPAGHIWPWKFITGLLKKLILLDNFNLQANTLVQNFEKQENGTYLIKTDRGDTVATKVIFATNAYTKALLPEFNGIITPKKGTVTHIRPKASPVPHLNFSSAIYYKDGDADYLINRPDGSIVCGGGENTFYQNRKDANEKYDNVDDSYNLKETELYLKDYAKKTFSTWKNFKAENDYTWSGILSESNDEFPYVGSLSLLGYDNCYVIAGFSGHGMPRVLLSGRALAKSIVSGEPLDDIPECFKISEKRLQKKFELSEKVKRQLNAPEEAAAPAPSALNYLKSYFV